MGTSIAKKAFCEKLSKIDDDLPGTGDYVQGMITGIEQKLSIEPNYNNGPYVSNARNLASKEFKTKIPKVVLSLDSPILYGDDR